MAWKLVLMGLVWGLAEFGGASTAVSARAREPLLSAGDDGRLQLAAPHRDLMQRKPVTRVDDRLQMQLRDGADFSAVHPGTQQSRFAKPLPSDYVQIDGSANPEMIPQWTAWSYAFRVIAWGAKLIPTVVLRHLSVAEATLLLEAAEAQQKTDAACQERVLRLRPLLLTEKAGVINEKTREIQLECRWRTLDTRDRVLAGLRPEGQNALVLWVESTKVGMHVSIPRRELAHYWQPQ